MSATNEHKKVKIYPQEVDSHLGIVTIWKLHNKVVSIGHARRSDDLLWRNLPRVEPKCDVVTNASASSITSRLCHTVHRGWVPVTQWTCRGEEHEESSHASRRRRGESLPRWDRTGARSGAPSWICLLHLDISTHQDDEENEGDTTRSQQSNLGPTKATISPGWTLRLKSFITDTFLRVS
jgi:hypothetical protein